MDKPLVIALVDDDRVYRILTSKLILESNLSDKVLQFSDGEEAINFIKSTLQNGEELPDIIFLDINMPYMDGWQFLDEYVKIKPSLKKDIILYLVSSSNNNNDLHRAEKYPEVTEYIIKPFTRIRIEELLSKR